MTRDEQRQICALSIVLLEEKEDELRFDGMRTNRK